MTVTCPSGHSSTTTDYCDQCGAPIGRVASAPGPRSEPAQAPGAVENDDTAPAPRQEPCPICTAPRSGDDRYCEGCGHDFLATPPTRPVWEVVVSADRDQYERFAAGGVSFPSECVERRFALDRPELRIGRSSGRPGSPAPEIDLAGAPEDPGISRLHAVLERQADGTYAVRDLGSTNGTTVGEDSRPIGSDAATRLADGDRIRLGAWTTITVLTRTRS
jgi:FHA domain